MKKIIVTGATSMIGVALIEECLRNNTSALAVVRKGSRRINRLPQSPLIETVECDLDKLSELGDELGEGNVFYHFAWGFSTKETRNNPELQYENIRYTLDAVKLAAQLKCRKFIGAGSQAEYGSVDGKIYPDSLVEPLSAYGIAKYAAGKLSRKLCDSLGLVHIWGRIFSVYGRNDNEGTMITYALEQYRKGEVAHFSAGLQNWNYLNERDAGRIFYLLGERADESKVYNVASIDTRPLRDYVLEMASVLGERFKYEFTEPSKATVYGIDPDIMSLVEDIQYVDKVSFGDCITILKSLIDGSTSENCLS